MIRAEIAIDKLQTSTEKYKTISSLHDRNEVLFYKLLMSNLEKFAPVIYTPTVGVACQEYGSLYRRPRGLYVRRILIDNGKVFHRVVD